MSNYGIKIVKPWFETTAAGETPDALSTTDADGILFDSEYFLFKALAAVRQTTIIPATAGVYTATFAHGLSYAPVIDGYWSWDNANWHRLGYRNVTYFTNHNYVNVSADTTNVYFVINTFDAAASGTLYLSYVTFVDSLT